MKIKSLDLRNLRNEEHFQYMTEVNGLISSNGADKLGVAVLYNTFTSLFGNEQEALNQVQKSALTTTIADADTKRDNTYRGMAYMVKSALSHFDIAVESSAQRLLVIVNSYGNLAKKNYNEETAGITKLVSELQGAYANDAAAVGITEWVVQLKADNEAFVSKMTERYDESAAQTQYKMKLVRNQIDDVYRQLVELIHAQMLVNGTEAFGSFVNDINQRIEKYGLTIAQRQGRKAKTSESVSE